MTGALALLAAGWVALASAAQPAPNFQGSAALFNLKCAKCHTVGRGDRVGPDLRGAATRHDKDWLVRFIMSPGSMLDADPAAQALLKRFHGVRMEETHLSRVQAEGVLAYIEAAGAAPSGPAEPAPLEEPALSAKLKLPEEGRTLSVPGLALMLLLLAAAAALWQWKAHASGGMVLVIALLAGYWAAGGRRYHRLLGNQQGYEPEQPVAFSHAQHAGKLKISCYYCHFGAERSDAAGVPPLNVCMNCHRAVHSSGGSDQPSPELAKLAGGRPPEWVRVHQLPDFVHFTHRVHVADNIQCQECHGPVEAMTRMRQASPLSMGWCVNCHRQGPGAAPTHWKRAGGPLDCAACHW